MLTNEAKQGIEKLPIVKSVEVFNEDAGIWKREIFPYDSAYKWNRDNFGPLYIPKKRYTYKSYHRKSANL